MLVMVQVNVAVVLTFTSTSPCVTSGKQGGLWLVFRVTLKSFRH